MRLQVDQVGRRQRSGFTLLELVVVITIMVILLSMTVGAVMKGFDWINRSNTERTITKVHERLERRFKGIEFDLKGMSPDAYDASLTTAGAVTPYALAGGTQDDDRRRAKVFLRKYLIKWSFPVNYHEAFVNASECGMGYPPAAGIYKRLAARLTSYSLASPPPIPPANSPQEAAEAAACLALVLQLNGMHDDLTPSELNDTNGDGFLEITDAYGHAMRFFRYGNIDAGLVTRAKLGFPTQNAAASAFDPDDPDGLMTATWLAAGTNATTFTSTFGYSLATPRVYAPLVIISAGRDGNFLTQDDNLDSYRLRLGVAGQ